MNGRESTIPDMMTEEGDVVDDAISRTEINTVPSKSKLPPSKRSNQAISSGREHCFYTQSFVLYFVYSKLIFIIGAPVLSR